MTIRFCVIGIICSALPKPRCVCVLLLFQKPLFTTELSTREIIFNTEYVLLFKCLFKIVLHPQEKKIDSAAESFKFPSRSWRRHPTRRHAPLQTQTKGNQTLSGTGQPAGRFAMCLSASDSGVSVLTFSLEKNYSIQIVINIILPPMLMVNFVPSVYSYWRSCSAAGGRAAVRSAQELFGVDVKFTSVFLSHCWSVKTSHWSSVWLAQCDDDQESRSFRRTERGDSHDWSQSCLQLWLSLDLWGIHIERRCSWHSCCDFWRVINYFFLQAFLRKSAMLCCVFVFNCFHLMRPQWLQASARYYYLEQWTNERHSV